MQQRVALKAIILVVVEVVVVASSCCRFSCKSSGDGGGDADEDDQHDDAARGAWGRRLGQWRRHAFALTYACLLGLSNKVLSVDGEVVHHHGRRLGAQLLVQFGQTGRKGRLAASGGNRCRQDRFGRRLHEVTLITWDTIMRASASQ